VGDPDGEITRVEFFADGRSVGVSTAAPFAVWWAGSTNGVVNLTARATDSLGLTAQSEPVSVMVAGNLSDLRLDPARVLRRPDGSFELRAVGQAGTRFRLEASATLTDWIPLATNTFTGAPVDLVDYQGTNLRERFYRVRLWP
jgi:hypothetical protein